jgi:hypothetical protein
MTYLNQSAVFGASVRMAGSLTAHRRPKPDSIHLIGGRTIQGSFAGFQMAEYEGNYSLRSEDESHGHGRTIVDITNPTSPALAEVIELPESYVGAEAPAGHPTLVVVRSSEKTRQVRSTSVVSIDLRDGGAGVNRTFSTVAAYQADHRRGLIHLVGADRLKILRRTVSPDPRVEHDYKRGAS